MTGRSLQRINLDIDGVRSSGDVVFVEARADREPEWHEVDGPASLLTAGGSDPIASQWLRYIGDRVFQLALFTPTRVPSRGERYELQHWWPPEVVARLRRGGWRKAIAPDLGGADWCPLTYETIDDGDEAYVNDRDEWISVRGWEEFVRDDQLRLATFVWPVT